MCCVLYVYVLLVPTYLYIKSRGSLIMHFCSLYIVQTLKRCSLVCLLLWWWLSFESNGLMLLFDKIFYTYHIRINIWTIHKFSHNIVFLIKGKSWIKTNIIHHCIIWIKSCLLFFCMNLPNIICEWSLRNGKLHL